MHWLVLVQTCATAERLVPFNDLNNLAPSLVWVREPLLMLVPISHASIASSIEATCFILVLTSRHVEALRGVLVPRPLVVLNMLTTRTVRANYGELFVGIRPYIANIK